MKGRGFEATQPKRGGTHYTYRRSDGLKITVTRPHGGKKTVNVHTVEQVLEELEL